MLRRSIWIILGAAAGLLAMAAPALAQQMQFPDRIVLQSGKQLPGIKITAAKVDKITYVRFGSSPGPEQSVASRDVDEIAWGDSPGDLRRAIADMKGANYARALQNLRKCPKQGPREFWYQPYFRLLTARCLVETDAAAKALDPLKDVISRYRDSYYVLDAIQLKARAHKQLGQFEKAAETSLLLDPQGNFDKPGATKPYGKLRQLQGVAGAIESYAKAPDKRDEASRLLTRLVEVIGTITANPPENLAPALPQIRAIEQRAIVSQADLLVQADKLDAAREWINQNASRVRDRSARLRLFMTLGDMAMKGANRAGVARDRKKFLYTQAALAYMRVYVLYPDLKELRGRAMFGAATASEQIAALAKGEKKPSGDKSRAIRLYKEVIRAYPGTKMATESKKRLEALGQG
jgi:tetratricopeptide (TPR) repeat protein